MLFPNGRWLMCCPDFYEVSYEINPWMSVSRAPHKATAWKQWKELHHTILRLGGWVEYVQQTQGQPDMVFTANAGLVRGSRAVLSRFRYKERQGEEAGYKRWFLDHGYEVMEVSECAFEGEGDALFLGNRLYAGTGFRTDISAYAQFSEFLGLHEIIYCELTDPYFYHLDTCFCPINEDFGLFYAPAFSPESRKKMEKSLNLISINSEDAKKFACNAVVLGQDVIIPSGCSNTAQILSDRGFRPHEIELDEFIKAGGAAKCLSLRLQ